jgi:hypothetical protein
MKLSHEEIAALEDLNSTQVRALKSLFANISALMADEVLKCSVGRGSPEIERELVIRKCNHEGSLKSEQLLFKELQAIRKAADNRVAT